MGEQAEWDRKSLVQSDDPYTSRVSSRIWAPQRFAAHLCGHYLNHISPGAALQTQILACGYADMKKVTKNTQEHLIYLYNCYIYMIYLYKNKHMYTIVSKNQDFLMLQYEF